LFLFYFAGHGISEGVGWNLFMVPGTFLYSGDLADRDIESIAALSMIALSDVVRSEVFDGLPGSASRAL
jgi:hypothetical protein